MAGLLVLLALTAGAQVTTTKRARSIGPAELEVTSEGVSVFVRGREYAIDPTQLRMSPSQCEENSARHACAASAGKNCLACIQEWQPIAWDDPQQILYIGASTGSGHNRPWMLLAFALRFRKLKQIGSYEGGGFDGNGSVSASGQYLAYVQYEVCGVCCTESQIAVVNLGTLRSRVFPIPAQGDYRSLIQELRWTRPATLFYRATQTSEAACRAGGQLKPRTRSGLIEVADSLR